MEQKFLSVFNIPKMFIGYEHQFEDGVTGLPLYFGKIKYFMNKEDIERKGYHIGLETEAFEVRITNRHIVSILAVCLNFLQIIEISNDNKKVLDIHNIRDYILNLAINIYTETESQIFRDEILNIFIGE